MWKPSYCETCDAPVPWYGLVPVFGYFFVGGQCRRCGSFISLNHWVGEGLSGLMVMGLNQMLPTISDKLVFGLPTMVLTLWITAEDFYEKKISLVPVIVLAFFSYLFWLLNVEVVVFFTFFTLMLFPFIFLLLYVFYRSKLGEGDVILAFAVAPWLLLEDLPVALFICSLGGLCFAYLQCVFQKDKQVKPSFLQTSIPLGPFILLGVFITPLVKAAFAWGQSLL